MARMKGGTRKSKRQHQPPETLPIPRYKQKSTRKLAHSRNVQSSSMGEAGTLLRRRCLASLAPKSRLDLLLVAREFEMSLELLRRHVRARRVEFRRAVQASNSGQPSVLDAFWKGLGLDRELRHGIEVRVLHNGFELVVGIALLKLFQCVNKPLWRRGLENEVSHLLHGC